MLLGIAIESYMLIIGGVTIFLLLAFQVLVGLRKVKFKGKRHMQVHKWAAYGLLAFAALHALSALAYLGII